MTAEDLYGDLLLDHARSPRGRGPVTEREALAEERNPLCGDLIRLTFRVEDGRIAGLRADSRGCAVCLASASLLAEYAEGRPTEEVRRTAERAIRWLRGEAGSAPAGAEPLEAVRRFPMRSACATLGWRALLRALE